MLIWGVPLAILIWHWNLMLLPQLHTTLSPSCRNNLNTRTMKPDAVTTADTSKSKSYQEARNIFRYFYQANFHLYADFRPFNFPPICSGKMLVGKLHRGKLNDGKCMEYKFMSEIWIGENVHGGNLSLTWQKDSRALPSN